MKYEERKIPQKRAHFLGIAALIGLINIPITIFFIFHSLGYLYFSIYVVFSYAIFFLWFQHNKRNYPELSEKRNSNIIYVPIVLYGLPLYVCSILLLIDTEFSWQLIRNNEAFIKWLVMTDFVSSQVDLGINKGSEEFDLFLVRHELAVIYVITLMLYASVLSALIQISFFSVAITDFLIDIYGTSKYTPLQTTLFIVLVAGFAVYYLFNPSYFNAPGASRETLRHAGYAMLPGFLGFSLLCISSYFRYLYQKIEKES